MRSSDHNELLAAAMELSHAVKILRGRGIIRLRRLIGDLGEWYVCVLYGGERMPRQGEKGSDICLSSGGGRLRVKTQFYDPENRWNDLGSIPTDFDRLIVVIMSDSLTIHTIYDVPAEELGSVLRMGDEGRPMYNRDDLEPWKVDLTKLPGYKDIAALIED